MNRFLYLALPALLLVSSPLLAGVDTRLADAMEKGNDASVRTLLGERVDPNIAQADGMTALHWAADRNNLEAAKLLIGAGAHASVKNRYGVTPLSLACVNGNTELIELLLKVGTDPNATLRGGETALMTAARTGKLKAVEVLIAHGANVNAKEWKGQTALMWAAADGHASVVNALIKAGADFRSPLPSSGFTPLCFAAREGRADVVQVLLKAGANVNETLPTRKNVSRAPRGGTSPLILAIENGHFDVALALVKAGADPNDQRSGFTPLHTLTWARKPPRGDGEEGEPPPMESEKLSSLQFVRELAAHGANVNARLEKGASGRGRLSGTGATALLMASKNADLEYMQLLMELGADPLLPNIDGCTPLMAAAGIGTFSPGEEAGTEPEALEAVRLLLSRGADVNTIDANGETAMHGAAYKSLPKVVQFLADHGAKIDIWNRKNKYGWTPLLIAQGFRPNNFKPSAETIVALDRVMRAAGVTPPAAPPASQYQSADLKGYLPGEVRPANAKQK